MTLKSIFLKVLAMYIMGKNAFKHILLIYGSFKHMSEMLKSETTHYMEEEEEEDQASLIQ